jgi:hypothetical protein
MSKLGIVKFSGKSGVRYAFKAFPLGTVFAKGFAGVYVITRRRKGKLTGRFAHRKIGTCQSDGLRQPLADGRESFVARGANCICLHAEKDQSARLHIEQDLLCKPSAGGAM